jgi:peptidoglycan/LPS O-acetylase OafA/YrhL
MGAIRLFLALAVFESHLQQRILVPAGLGIDNRLVLGMNGGFAVMFFFVVSGFLISFVLEQKYNRPGGTAAFYRARALRIYPLWWCLYLLVPLTVGGGLWSFVTQRHVYDLIAGFFLYGSDLMLSFWTYPKLYNAPLPHDLAIGWSLATELTFYALAPFILRSKIWPVVILSASVLSRIVLNAAFPIGNDATVWTAWCYVFFPATVMFFMLGHLTRQLHKKLKLPSWSAWLAIALGVAALLRQDGNPVFDNKYFYLAIGLFAVALPAIFDATKDNRICNFLGDLTYPLYLSGNVFLTLLHMPGAIFDGIGQTVQTTAMALPFDSIWPKAAFISVTLWCLVVPVAAAVHYLIEKPATACVRAALTLFDRRREAAALAVVAERDG